MQKNKLILSADQTRILSKTQAKFNSLVAKIEELKARKTEFETKIKEVEIKYHKQVLPLAMESKNAIIKLVFAFDDAFDQYKLTAKEREAISRFIVSNCEDFLNTIGIIEEDQIAALKDLYAKHEGSSFDEDIAEKDDTMSSMFEQMFGMKIDPEKLNDKDYMEEMNKQFYDKMGFKEPKERKKTKKQLEAEAKEKEAEDKMKKDARGIYTQLAKLLHPDKEQDEVLREQKSELMKRVTNAYSENDLYELLQIQLEVEQMDSDALANVSDDLMSSYVKVLQKQVNEIEMEISYKLRQNPIVQQFFTYTDKFSDSKFKKVVKEIKDGNEMIRQQVNRCNTQQDFKNFAKELAQEFKQMDKYDNMFSGFDFFSGGSK
jgi:hypothetical protein